MGRGMRVIRRVVTGYLPMWVCEGWVEEEGGLG
jgi:hypothetical protein